MPLIRIDVVEGRRSPEEITLLLDTVHTEMVTAFETPGRDRYQIVHEHPRHQLVVQDTGLRIERTDDVVQRTEAFAPGGVARGLTSRELIRRSGGVGPDLLRAATKAGPQRVAVLLDAAASARRGRLRRRQPQDDHARAHARVADRSPRSRPLRGVPVREKNTGRAGGLTQTMLLWGRAGPCRACDVVTGCCTTPLGSTAGIPALGIYCVIDAYVRCTMAC